MVQVQGYPKPQKQPPAKKLIILQTGEALSIHCSGCSVVFWRTCPFSAEKARNNNPQSERTALLNKFSRIVHVRKSLHQYSFFMQKKISLRSLPPNIQGKDKPPPKKHCRQQTKTLFKGVQVQGYPKTAPKKNKKSPFRQGKLSDFVFSGFFSRFWRT